MTDSAQDHPPILKTWTAWYALVLGFLLFEIIIFLILTAL